MRTELDEGRDASVLGHLARPAFVAMVGGGVLFGVHRRGTFDEHPWLLVLDLLLGAVALVVVWFRHRLPLAVAGLTSALTAVSAAATGAAALAMMSLATRRDRGRIAIAAAVNVTAAIVNTAFVLDGDLSDPDELVGVFIPVAALIGWGLYIGVHRDLVASLRSRAERAETEQEHRLREARATERTRIAREMHDVVAHRISQVSMRAGALVYRTDLPAREMRAETALIRDTANEALRELRAVLHVLRDPSSGALIDPPQPTHDDLSRLVGQAISAGADIRFDDRVDGVVPDETGRTIYRIIQEAITNATKHAPGAAVSIEIDDRPDGELLVTVSNDVTPVPDSLPGSGLGIAGMTERVEVAGGRLESGVVGGRFVLSVNLPAPD